MNIHKLNNWYVFSALILLVFVAGITLSDVSLQRDLLGELWSYF